MPSGVGDYRLRERSGTMRGMELSTGRPYDLSFNVRTRNEAAALRFMGESQVWMRFYDTCLIRGKRHQPDPYSYMTMHFDGMPWRCYVIGGFQTYEIDFTCEREEIRGCYPSWDFKKFNLRELQDYIENPWGTSYELSHNVEPSWREIPNKNQQHKVFIWNMRAGRSHAEKDRTRRLARIQELYPEVELVLVLDNATYATQFGMDFTASAVDLSTKSAKGGLIDPYGKDVDLGELRQKFMGYNDRLTGRGWTKPDDWDFDSTFKHNIATSRYAAHHWKSEFGLAPTSRWNPMDYTSPTAIAGMPSYSRHNSGPAISITDKILCDRCLLAPRCNSFKAGEVCNLPKEPTGNLARLAKSRDPKKIIELMSTVVAHQAERVEGAMEDEFKDGEGANTNIDKQLNNLFKNSVTLAKLLDPRLGRPAPGPLVQINTGASVAATQLVANADPRELSAHVVAQIEAKGVARDDITPAMIEEELERIASEAGVIEGEIV